MKADGLAAGKGVVVCRTLEEADAAVTQCLEARAFGDAGRTVVIEEFLEGEEASFFALSDGTTVLPLTAAQDHKTVWDDDRGPNTGGMGAYSPAPVLDARMQERVMAEIVRPTIAAMAAEGAPYTGVLFVGLMITREGPKVIEFNCRFGDPECQAILPRLEDDLLALLLAAATGKGLPPALAWSPRSSVCVVHDLAAATPGATRPAGSSPGWRPPPGSPASTSSTRAPRSPMARSSPRAAACWACRRRGPTWRARSGPRTPRSSASASTAPTTGATSAITP